MTSTCPACEAPPLALAVAVAERPGDVVLSVPGMRCAACIHKIEATLRALSGVSDARVNLTLRRVNVTTTRAPQALTEALERAGFAAHVFDTAALGSDKDATGRDLILRVGVAGFAMMNVMLLSVAVWSGASDATRDLFHLLSAAIALPAALYAAQPFFRSAATALRRARLNMDVPISLAIVLAGGMSLFEALNGGAHAYFDAALSLTFFLLIGRLLEHRTRAAARSAAKELSALEVHTAQRIRGTQTEAVPASDLAIGDRILVPTGMRVPVDGRLRSAQAVSDRSLLTGESEPVTLTHAASLSAGEVNIGAPFEMVAEAVGNDTRLRRMARMVETAETARNGYTSLADRAAQIYAPAVHLLALLSFAGWFITTGDARHALNIAIAVLIITCPCALGLAVPAVSTAAIGRLYRLGFLIKSGTALERLAEVDAVVFDKTGTLTAPGFTFATDALAPTEAAIAKALAQASSHPVSQALARYLEDVEPASIDEIHEFPGCGVSGHWRGTPVALGQATWLGAADDGLGLRIGHDLRRLPSVETPKAGAVRLGGALAVLGLPCTIMSGDTADKTKALAEQLRLDEWRADMTPADKHDHITEMIEEGHRPCMVGDGLNDTAALAAAHASVAPGTALDAARNAADVVMIGDALKHLPALFALCRKATRLYRQNFAIALAYNAVAIPVAMAGLATPLLAALAMSASSITVLLNATRART